MSSWLSGVVLIQHTEPPEPHTAFTFPATKKSQGNKWGALGQEVHPSVMYEYCDAPRFNKK